MALGASRIVPGTIREPRDSPGRCRGGHESEDEFEIAFYSSVPHEGSGCRRAPRRFQDGSEMALGASRIVPGTIREPRDSPGRCRGGHGRFELMYHYLEAVGRSELTFSHVLGPSDALALRPCSEIAQGQVKNNPPLWLKGGFWAQGGNL